MSRRKPSRPTKSDLHSKRDGFWGRPWVAPAILLALVMMHAVSCWPRILNRYVHPYAWRIDQVDWKAGLRLTPESDYLRSHLSDYDIGLVLERTVPAGEPVFTFSGIQQAYQSHPIVVEWTSFFGVRVSESLRTPFTRVLQPTGRWEFRFAPITTPKIRITQLASSDSDRWSISELRIFRDGAELARAPEWRLIASSNPWDVGAAFDKDAITRWTSYRTFQPGMFVEVDFEGPKSIDTVTADAARDQEGVRMCLDYQTPEGEWRSVPQEALLSDIPPPNGLRRAAIEEMQRHNLHWLLVHDLEHDRGAGDFYRYQKLWGIRLVAESGHYKLYKLE